MRYLAITAPATLALVVLFDGPLWKFGVTGCAIAVSVLWSNAWQDWRS